MIYPEEIPQMPLDTLEERIIGLQQAIRSPVVLGHLKNIGAVKSDIDALTYYLGRVLSTVENPKTKEN